MSSCGSHQCYSSLPSDFMDNLWLWVGLRLNFQTDVVPGSTKYVDLGTLLLGKITMTKPVSRMVALYSRFSVADK